LLKLTEKLKPYHGLIQSLTSLSILQIANYLFPLIVLPYVVRVLGPAKYGLINFAAAFIAYFNLLCEYGFSLSGTKGIAQIRENKETLSRKFSVILSVKLIFFLISLFVLIIVVSSIPFFNKNWELYMLSFGFVLGSVLFPNWFYQGMEQMKYITIIQVLVRSISTVLIFLLIKAESDFLLLVFLNVSAQIIIGIFGLLIALYKFNIKFKLPVLEEIKSQLKEGWHIFLSTISINIYTTSNTFILGLFVSDTVVGYFSAADKIRLAFQGFISVISQSVFPYISKLFKESRQDYLIFIKILMKIQITLGFLASLFLFIFSHELIYLIIGAEFNNSVILLRIISLLPFIISIGNIYGVQITLTQGFEKAFNSIVSASALLHIILLLILASNYFATGTTIAIVITEFLLTLFMLLFVRKKKLLLYKL